MPRPSDIKSLHRATELLLYLASSNEPRSFTKIRQELGMGKSTAHRFLATLENVGLVRRAPDTGYYVLGLVALKIGIAAGNQLELRKIIRPYLTALTERTGETSNLVVLDGTKPVFIDNVESTNSLRMYSRVGRHTSPYATSAGKAILAHQPADVVELVLEREPLEQRTSKSITNREAFLEELARVRQQGFAVDDEEGEIGARCVGAPILDHQGNAVAAISISGPSSRVSKETLTTLGQIVRETALEAQRSLGMHLHEAVPSASQSTRRPAETT